MKTSRWMVLGILPLAGALALLAGCNAQGSGDEETAAAPAKVEAEAPAAAARAERGRMGGMRGAHGPGMMGPAHLLGVALHELDLSDAQRATIQGELSALRDGAEAKPDRAAFDAHRAALAAAIRSGKIDEASIPMPAPPARDTSRVAKALQVLHDTLTAEQRKQLVDTASAKDADRPFGRMGKHDGRGFGGKRGMGGEMGGPLGHAIRDLDLTDAQREKVSEAMKALRPAEGAREAMKAQHEAFAAARKARLQTFASDAFDAAAFAAPPKDAPGFGKEMGPGRMVKVLAAVVPILTDTQREALAKSIEAGPQGDMPCDGPGAAQ